MTLKITFTDLLTKGQRYKIGPGGGAAVKITSSNWSARRPNRRRVVGCATKNEEYGENLECSFFVRWFT